MQERASDIEHAVTRATGGFDKLTGAEILRAVADSTAAGESWTAVDLRKLAEVWWPSEPRSGKVW